MTTLCDCESVAERAAEYVERRLTKVEMAAIDAHLDQCQACCETMHYSRAVHGLIAYVGAGVPESAAASGEDSVAADESPALLMRLSGAPWWFVSMALHALVIVLAGLVSMAIELPRGDDAVIMTTELQPRPTEVDPAEREKPQDAAVEILNQKSVAATDPTSTETSRIEVPPDILAKAELGDHFETINPDRPDTQSAYGNPDATSYHSVSGNSEAAGGGGAGGVGMEDLIGVGGGASRGSGGGFGGGDGTGVGNQSGAGKGSFGQRNGGGRKLMVKRNGGSKATESAVDSALRWLAYHQEADGHWDAIKHGGGADWNNQNGGHHYDVAMTGLALLAFLGAGHTEKVGQWKDNVQRAVGWLKRAQGADGGVSKEFLASTGYEQAIMTMALAEAAGMANIPETRAAAQRAVDYCTEIHQQGDGSQKGAWRYLAKEAPDISVSGWFVMALKSAKVAGLHVNHATFEGAMSFLDKVEVKLPGGDGVDPAYGPVLNYHYQPAAETLTFQTTAIGLLCRQFMGYKKDDLQNSVEWFVKKGGTGKPNSMYYCYYGTLCTFQQGGDIWTKWNEGMKPALLDNQDKVGDDAGSWGPSGKDPFYGWWGRVGATSLAALSLEVYYRYKRLGDK